jgi:hypothetical protein
MNEGSTTGVKPEEMLSSWLKTAAEFWKNAPGMGSSPLGVSPSKDGETTKSRTQASWESGMKAWSSMLSTLMDPQMSETVQKAGQTVPEMMLKFLNTGIKSAGLLQKRWSDRLKKGDFSQPYDFQDLDREFLDRWTEVYQTEFKKFLQIPQVGLFRSYQERINQTMDRYCLFQAAAAEFMHLLSLPVEKSFRALQEKLSEMAEAGTLPEDSKAYYQMWIRILEGHFMTLFKSPEYTNALGKTLDSLNVFLASKDQTMEDMLKQLPVPTQREMDDLYKENYLLKKRIRIIEKKLAALGPA